MIDWSKLMIKTFNRNATHWSQKLKLFFCLLLFVIISSVSTAHPYQLTGYKWPQPSATFYVDIPGEDGLWDDAFEGAMYEWGVDTIFKYYIIRGTYSDPCNALDHRNGVRFDSTNCGEAWGSTTLAITQSWYKGTTISESDIVFNSIKPWNVYSGPWSYYVNDFSRVAVHELGHVLGLGHEDSGVSTIMGSYAGDNIIPLADDINGVAAIYGATVCTYSIFPSSGSFSAIGGNSSVTVTTSGPNCVWTTSENLSWVSLSPSSGTGSGTVTVTVTANTSTARSGSITIAGKIYTINQAEPIDNLNDDSRTPVYQFYSPTDDRHYFTNREGEKDYIIANWSNYWSYVGIAWYGFATEQPGTIPVYQFYSPSDDRHYFTSREGEKDYIIANWPNYWSYVGVAWYAYAVEEPGTIPVYQFYSSSHDRHYFTSREEEKDYIIANWSNYWSYVGIAWYGHQGP
jgi:hypothetical protein